MLTFGRAALTAPLIKSALDEVGKSMKLPGSIQSW